MIIKNYSIVREDLNKIIESNLDWEQFRGKRILITGAAGMIGAYLAEVFTCLADARGIKCEVIGLVRSAQRAAQRLSHITSEKNFSLLEANVSSNWNLKEPVDFVIHAASIASPVHYTVNPLDVIQANTSGLISVFNNVKEGSCQSVLFISTAEVYGTAAQGVDFVKESDLGTIDITDPRSCYAESKRCGEALCIAARNALSIPTQIIRPFHTYGPGLKGDDGRIFADLVRDIVDGKPLNLSSDGSAVRSFCYISDAIEGMIRVLLNGDGKPYNIGNPENSYSVKDLAALLAEKYSLDFSAKPAKSANPVSRVCPDISRLKLLGWSPAVNVTEGFDRTIRSYK